MSLDYSAPNLRGKPRNISPEQAALEKQVTDLFDKQLKIDTVDGRNFTGFFTCLDSDGNVVMRDCSSSGWYLDDLSSHRPLISQFKALALESQCFLFERSPPVELTRRRNDLVRSVNDSLKSMVDCSSRLRWAASASMEATDSASTTRSTL